MLAAFARVSIGVDVACAHPHLVPVSPVFWLMMQIGMVLGLLTTAPMNRWLVSTGLKEKMG